MTTKRPMSRILDVGALLALALLLAACAEFPPGSYAVMPLDGQAVTPGQYVYDLPGGRYAFQVAQADTTAEPSVTPSPTPSVTPSPTPSQTPIATDEPGDPTPTQEGPPVTSTPNPTTPEPKPTLCEGIVINNAGLNVRADHRVTAPLRGTLSADDVAIIDAFYIVTEGREEWVHIVEPIEGWVAGIFYDGRRMLWWPEDLSDGERAVWCLPPYVSVEYESDPLPSTPTAWHTNPRGLHLIYSAPRDPVLAALPALGTLKATDGAESLLLEAKRRKPEIVTIYRTLYTPIGKLDCPPDWGLGDPVLSANAWYDLQRGTWRDRALLDQVDGRPVVDYFEYRNECRFAGDWEVSFDLQLVRRATADGICLAMFSDAPGTPEVHEFARRRPVLDAMLAEPCRPGQWHAIAHHIYFTRHSGTWLFGRYKLFREAVGPKYKPLAFIFTEYGMPSEDGTATGRGAPNCAAGRQELEAIDPVFQADGAVIGYHAYSVGPGTEWTDLTPCLAVLT